MTPEEIAEKEATAAKEAEAKAKAEADATPDPLKKELEKVQAKSGRTEAEKAAFSLMKNAERAKELGLDPKKVLGLDDEKEEDDKPITHGELRKLEQERAQKSALDRANDIEDETERDLVKHHLVSTIKPSGNADEDLKNARAIVNSVKNSQIAEEANRKSQVRGHSSGAGAPGKHEEGGDFDPNPDELALMRGPFKVTKEQIIEARKKSQ